MARNKQTDVQGDTEINEEVTEEQQLADQEANEEAGEPTPAVDELIPGGISDLKSMTPAQILERLAQRRAELNQLTTVAKERGVIVPKTKKDVVPEAERLEEFIGKLGYSIGMRHWAESRMETEGSKVNRILGDEVDPERAGELTEVLVRGYIKAKLQTSFPSKSMPDKKVAESITPDKVAEEFWTHVTDADREAFKFLSQLV